MTRQKGLLNASLAAILAVTVSGCGVDKEPGGNNNSGNPQACSTTDLPFTPLRRLTRYEYANSVRDLLKVDTSAVKSLPADEADGFDNNAHIQVAADFLVEKYVVVSEELAALAVQDVNSLTGCNPNFAGAESCARQFAQSFGRRAFRRPISSTDEAMFMAAYDAGASGGTYADGIEVMIRMALQSPNFLYRLETAVNTSEELIPLDPYEMATRLSYFIWGTGPDDALLDAAAAGQLNTKEQVAAKAREMLGSAKARDSLTNFLEQWSDVRKLENITKNTNLFPNYSNDVRDAMMRELPAFLDYLFDSNDVTLNNLFTANVAFVSGPLADIYGVARPFNSGTTPQMVTLPEEHNRAGLLTQAGFMAVQGHPDQTSPVLRGKFVRANLLCDPPPPPPDDVNIAVPEITVGTTARDRADIHLSAGGSCAGCHTLMDPIGLAFENFDAMGQYQEYEGGSAIDVSGEVLFVNDADLEGPFVGVKELAHKLAASSLVKECVATQMFRFAAGRFETQGDDCSLSTMQDAFKNADGDFIELMVSMTQTDAFLYKTQGGQ